MNNLQGERIKTLREEHKYTQKQVADFLEIDQSNLSKIELGKRTISMDLIEELCSLFNCSEEYILGESDKYNPSNIAFRKNKKIDLNIIAQINETMNYIKLLRELDED